MDITICGCPLFWPPSCGARAAHLLRSRAQAQLSKSMKSWLWNQFQTSGTVTRKVGQRRHRASTSLQDRYLTSSTRRHKRTTALQNNFNFLVTLLLCLEEEFPGKQFTHGVLPEAGLYAVSNRVCPLTASS
ncbi:hypothetical protein TNCV_2754271 [Trichonephila clavipes]|nr:hypothetical protein TNCV_2754271 [Trichonephila clavipes]